MVPAEEDLLIDMALIPNLLENRDRSRIIEVFSDRVLLYFLKRRTRFFSYFFSVFERSLTQLYIEAVNRKLHREFNILGT